MIRVMAYAIVGVVLGYAYPVLIRITEGVLLCTLKLIK